MTMSGEPIVVVGGGFTGCMTALRLVQAGHVVTLHETQPHLGGTLRDAEELVGFSTRRFLRGCQYADADAPWRSAVEALVDEHLDDVPHTMGSVTWHGESVHVAHDVAVPMLGGALPSSAYHANGELSAGTISTLADRLATYDTWAPWLTRFVERSGHSTSVLAERAALGMQLSRVVAADVPTVDVMACKARSNWADTHLAIPRIARSAEPLRALVPRNGWTPFFDAMRRYLEQHGVVVHTGVPLRVRGAEGRVVAEGPELPSSATYVWAGSPVPLHKAIREAFPDAGFARLDNIAMSAVHVHADVANWSGPVPHYVQWFDADSPLFRLYVYRMAGRVQACFECRGPLDHDAVHHLVDDVAQQCTGMGLAAGKGELRFAPVQVAPLRLYHLQTARDVEQLSRFGQFLASWQPQANAPMRAVIDGAWLAYGREHKLRNIKTALDQRGLDVAW